MTINSAPSPNAESGATRVNDDGSDPDNWDEHWDKYGDAAARNPANIYRYRLVLKLLGDLPPGVTLLDIGSGQGQLSIAYQKQHPHIKVWGVEHSVLGVRRAQQAAQRAAVPARFVERDLLAPVALDEGQPLADYAVCSEVLEHVADPTTLMRNAMGLLAPGAKVVVTVPGGPRSAFDRHIGHFRHFRANDLHQVLSEAGLEVDRVFRSGFPFFNLYKLAVIAQGKRFAAKMDARPADGPPPRLENAVSAVFRGAFQLNLDDFRWGWQMCAIAHVPAAAGGE